MTTLEGQGRPRGANRLTETDGWMNSRLDFFSRQVG
jgi:hypothetical protein